MNSVVVINEDLIKSRISDMAKWIDAICSVAIQNETDKEIKAKTIKQIIDIESSVITNFIHKKANFEARREAMVANSKLESAKDKSLNSIIMGTPEWREERKTNDSIEINLDSEYENEPSPKAIDELIEHINAEKIKKAIKQTIRDSKSKKVKTPTKAKMLSKVKK